MGDILRALWSPEMLFLAAMVAMGLGLLWWVLDA